MNGSLKTEKDIPRREKLYYEKFSYNLCHFGGNKLLRRQKTLTNNEKNIFSGEKIESFMMKIRNLRIFLIRIY